MASKKGKGGRPTGNLTDQQLAFVLAYFENGFHQTEAARSAGYAHPTVAAVKLMKLQQVQDEIARRRQKLEQKHEVTRERIIAEYAKIAFSSLGDLIEVDSQGNGWIDLTRLTDEQRAAVSEFTVDEYKEGRGDDGRDVKRCKIKLGDKKAALDSLARILGMFNDKVTLEASSSLVERLQRGRDRVKKPTK